MAAPRLQDPSIETADLRLVAAQTVKARTQRHSLSALWSVLLSCCEALADTLAVMGAALFANTIYHHFQLGRRLHYPPARLAVLAVVFSIIVVLLLDRAGAYRGGSSLLRVRETERILRASMQSTLIALTVSYFSNLLVSRWLLGIALITVPAFLMIEKQLIYALIRTLHARGHGKQRVLIYGAGMTGQHLFSAIARSPKLGLDPVVFLDDDPSLAGTEIYERSYQRRRFASVIQGPLTAGLLREYGVDLVLIGVPSLGREKFLEIIQEANAVGATVSFVPYHHGPTLFWMDYAEIDGLLVANLRGTAADTLYEATKRCFDVVAALALLIACSPFLLLIAALIRLTSNGPALFVQQRAGLDGKLFRMFKFRTMYQDAPAYQYCPKDSSDPRITTMGRFLRRTSLDELPQILNVLKGEMSLVGPRPEMPFIVSQYTALHRQRLTVKPGLTGLWQLSADRAYLIHENIEYDLYYIRRRNFFMDMAVLLHTVVFAARGI